MIICHPPIACYRKQRADETNAKLAIYCDITIFQTTNTQKSIASNKLKAYSANF